MIKTFLSPSRTKTTDSLSENSSPRGKKRGRYTEYDDNNRAQIAKYAILHGNASAARHFAMNESTIRYMKKQYQKSIRDADSDISSLPKRARGRTPMINDYETDVLEFCTKLRQEGGILNSNILRAGAHGIVKHRDRSSLVEFGGRVDFTRGWARSFLRRHHFVKRKGTKAARKLPADFEIIKKQYLEAIHNTIEQFNIPDELVINFDQTGVNMVPTGGWTLEIEGSKQVGITGLHDKRQITVLIGAAKSGHLLPLQLLYGGKTEACHPKFSFPSEFDVWHTESHWSTEDSMLRYAEKILIPYIDGIKEKLDLPIGQKTLCIFDTFASHKTLEFRNILHKNFIKIRYVPGGCTGELQPLDLEGNADFKTALKEEFVKWYSDKVAQSLEQGSPLKIDLKLSTIKPIHASWVLRSFDSLAAKPDVLIRGFKKAGIL